MVRSDINVPAAFYTSQETHLTALDSDNFCLDFFMFLPYALYELPGRLGF